jgi:hypothetical protein
MKKVEFKNRTGAKISFRILIMAIAIGMFAVSCDKDDKGKKKDPELSLDEKVKAAFQQFGLDVEQVKPKIGEPYEITLQYGNEISTTVYYRKAAYMEKLSTDVDKAAGHAYNERMFNYIKTVAADGKIYGNITMSDGSPGEIESYQALVDSQAEYLIKLYFYSYKYDGMWIDVYPEWAEYGKDIGISMNGSGTY